MSWKIALFLGILCDDKLEAREGARRSVNKICESQKYGIILENN